MVNAGLFCLFFLIVFLFTLEGFKAEREFTLLIFLKFVLNLLEMLSCLQNWDLCSVAVDKIFSHKIRGSPETS